MPIDRRMDKEDVVHIYTGVLAIKSNKIRSFVETWMNVDTVIQSEVRKRKTNIIY